MSRRAFVASLLASSASLLVPRLARAKSGSVQLPKRGGGPKKLILVHLMGGMDEMYTVNPKERSQVKDGIFPVYEPAELVTRGTMKLGPAWSELEPYMSRMQIIHGIQCNTVSHYTGIVQVEQMKTRIGSRFETSFVTRAGEALAPQAPLHSLELHAGSLLGKNSTPGRGFADVTNCKTLMSLHRIANDEAARDAARRALAAEISSRGPDDSRDAFKIVEHLLDKMQNTTMPETLPPIGDDALRSWTKERPDFVAEATTTPGLEYSWTLFALVNDLAPVVLFNPRMDFDSHSFNHDTQYTQNLVFAHRMKTLLDGLAATKTAEGTLLDEVGVVVVSELGRFPYVNPRHGKDHFPQLAVTLIGPGLKHEVFGETDATMMGAEVSLKTGRAGGDGSLLTLDDLGRTLLEWVGHPDPGGIGFDGRVMEFCFA